MSRADWGSMSASLASDLEVVRTLEQELVMTAVINVNGEVHRVDVDGDTPLLWVLRDVLGLTGTKFGCGIALCGACTVHIDGHPVRSCITPLDSIGLSAVTAIEVIGATIVGAKLQAAWLDWNEPLVGGRPKGADRQRVSDLCRSGGASYPTCRRDGQLHSRGESAMCRPNTVPQGAKRA